MALQTSDSNNQLKVLERGMISSAPLSGGGLMPMLAVAVGVRAL